MLHFLFECSSNDPIIGSFSAVNESVWEHLKLIFFPLLVSTIVGYFFVGKNITNFLCAQTIGIVVALVFIVVFFYTYTGIIGKHIALLDIAIFFVSIFISTFLSYKIIFSHHICNNLLSVSILIFLFFCFVIFTYFPPQIPLFLDSTTKLYGIKK